MYIGAERHYEIAYFLADTVLLTTLEVHGDGCGGGLGSDGGGIAWDLVSDKDEGIFT